MNKKQQQQNILHLKKCGNYTTTQFDPSFKFTFFSKASFETQIRPFSTDNNNGSFFSKNVKQELTQVKQELTQSETKLTQAETKLTQAKQELTQAETKLTQAKQELTQAETKLTQAKEDNDEFGIQSAETQITNINSTITQLTKTVNILSYRVLDEGTVTLLVFMFLFCTLLTRIYCFY